MTRASGVEETAEPRPKRDVGSAHGAEAFRSGERRKASP
jgi:hypothetical protein